MDIPIFAAFAKPIIEIGGAELDRGVDQHRDEIEVVSRLAMPDMFRIAFHDPLGQVLQSDRLKIGESVKISAAVAGGPKVLIDGEITSLELECDEDGSTFAIVRGYDKSHRLGAQGKTRSFPEMTIGDIVKKIAADANLSADKIDDPGIVMDHVMQANVPDLDFLYELASRSNRDLRVTAASLSFLEPTKPAEATPIAVAWGRTLKTFHARSSGVGQVTKVEVHGWNPVESDRSKQAIVGIANADAAHVAIDGQAITSLAEALEGAKLVVTRMPVKTVEEAEAVASARAKQVGSAGFEATAVIDGDPRAVAGAVIDVAGVPTSFAGKWVVTTARHRLGGSEGYRTTLELSGRADRSLLGAIHGGARSASPQHRFDGVVQAIVHDVQDPEGLGRVKLKFPWLDEDTTSAWARVVMPGAGPEYGMYWIPQVDDEVLVAFLHGSIDLPYVLGGLWNGKDKPPITFEFDNGTVKECGFRSRRGHQIAIHDDEQLMAIRIATADDKVSLYLDETNSEFAISVKGKVTIETGDGGDITVKAAGNLTLEAGQNVTIKGTQVAIN